MANNALWAALFGGTSDAIGGYQNTQRYNQQTGMQKKRLALEQLSTMIQQARMQQAQQQFEDQMKMRQQELDFGKRKMVADTWTDMMTGAQKAMADKGQAARDLEDKKAFARYMHDLGAPSYGGGGGQEDPSIVNNRRLTGQKNILSILGGAIDRNRNREYDEYIRAGGKTDPNSLLPIENPPRLGTSWGREGRVNPAIKEQNDWSFWNMDNPAARDSAAVLEGLINNPLYRELYGGGQQAAPTNQISFNDAVGYVKELINNGEEVDWNYIQSVAPNLDINQLRSAVGR